MSALTFQGIMIALHEDILMKCTLYNVEFCQSSVGIWDKQWFLSEKAAETFRAKKIKEFGHTPEDLENLEMCGEYGDIYEVEAVEVELSPKGLLHFANEYAVDTGAC